MFDGLKIKNRAYSDRIQPGSNKKTLIEGKAVRWGMFIRPLLWQFVCFCFDQGSGLNRDQAGEDGRQWDRGRQDRMRGLSFLQIEPDRLHALTGLLWRLGAFMTAGMTYPGTNHSRGTGAVAENGEARGEGHQQKQSVPLYGAHSGHAVAKLVRFFNFYIISIIH